MGWKRGALEPGRDLGSSRRGTMCRHRSSTGRGFRTRSLSWRSTASGSKLTLTRSRGRAAHLEQAFAQKPEKPWRLKRFKPDLVIISQGAQ